MGSIFSENIHKRLLDVIFQKTVFFMVTFNRQSRTSISPCLSTHFVSEGNTRFGQNLLLLVCANLSDARHYAILVSARALKILILVLCTKSGPGSVVGIATGYGLDGLGIESRWRRDFPHLSTPSLGPTQPSVQWVPGFSRAKEWQGRDADPSPPSSTWSWKGRAIPLLPLWAVRPVQSLSACTRVHFTFLLCTKRCNSLPFRRSSSIYSQQDRQCTYRITMRGVRLTIVAGKISKYYAFWVCV